MLSKLIRANCSQKICYGLVWVPAQSAEGVCECDSLLHLCFLAPQLVSQLPAGDDLLLFAPDGVFQVALLAVIPAAGASSIAEAAKGCVGPTDKQ